MEKWLETFLEEKGIDLELRLYNVWSGTAMHMVSGEVVKEAILKANTQEKRFIKETLVKIDFQNGDINHFLKHLAKCYVTANY